MEKVLVTGAGGFIGSHLTERLVEAGLAVRAFIHYNAFNSWGWLEHSPYLKEIEIFRGDIRDFDSVYSSMKDCTNVYHMAALIAIPYSYESPLAYIRTNIEGTYNILQSALVQGQKQLIVTSTSEVYGTAQFVPISENHPLAAQSPYSATKIAADQLAISFHRSYELPVKIARPFNAFGPRQSARAVIPTVIAQVLFGRSKIRLGNISPIRDFTYVLDTVEGLLEISKSDDLLGQVTNIGMGSGVSIKQIVALVSELCNVEVSVTQDDERVRPVDSEVERLICDNSKIMEKTQWRPQYTLEQGIEETLKWMRNNLAYYKAEIYNK